MLVNNPPIYDEIDDTKEKENVNIINLVDVKSHESILVDDEKEIEGILSKRHNEDNDRIEYLAFFFGYPIENSEWLIYEDFPNKKMIKNFEKRLYRSEKISRKINKRYHHIGQNSLHKFLHNAKYVEKWCVEDFDGIDVKYKKKKKVNFVDLTT